MRFTLELWALNSIAKMVYVTIRALPSSWLDIFQDLPTRGDHPEVYITLELNFVVTWKRIRGESDSRPLWSPKQWCGIRSYALTLAWSRGGGGMRVYHGENYAEFYQASLERWNGRQTLRIKAEQISLNCPHYHPLHSAPNRIYKAYQGSQSFSTGPGPSNIDKSGRHRDNSVQKFIKLGLLAPLPPVVLGHLGMMSWRFHEDTCYGEGCSTLTI